MQTLRDNYFNAYRCLSLRGMREAYWLSVSYRRRAVHFHSAGSHRVGRRFLPDRAGSREQDRDPDRSGRRVHSQDRFCVFRQRGRSRAFGARCMMKVFRLSRILRTYACR